MAFTYSTGLKNQILSSITKTGAGGNFDSGILEIRTGAAPGPDAAATGTVLATITLPASPFGTVAAGAVGLAGTWQDTSADATGTAAHFRLRETGDANGSSSTARRIEGTVGVGSGDLQLVTTSLVATETVTVTSFALSI